MGRAAPPSDRVRARRLWQRGCLPAVYFLFLVAATLTYLLLVEMVKRRLIARLLGKHP